ncbi:MAG: chorismate synthase [Clostridia bacterium]|nr:chorismate synthase [Clostridia bacterium]
MEYKGKKLTVSVYGHPHGPCVGMVMTGLPAGVPVDTAALQAFLARRAPGQSSHTTARKEPDLPEFCSGLINGRTDGEPLRVEIPNQDIHSRDYAQFRDVPRPSHADYPALMKYGEAYDIRGGGPFSARMTAPLCAAGGIALQWLRGRGIRVGAHIASIGGVQDDPFDPVGVTAADFDRVLQHEIPVLNPRAGSAMLQAVDAVRQAGDSLGGAVECAVLGLPAGLGGPLFEGLESSLGAAIFAIPAVKGVAFGSGFEAAFMRGSEHNDPYRMQNGRVVTETNHAGGLLGGMTTGMPLILKAAFKPTPSIALPQKSVSLSRGEDVELRITGRHDPCVVLRAVPIVEAVTALALMDQML